jgi:DNA polymerase
MQHRKRLILDAMQIPVWVKQGSTLRSVDANLPSSQIATAEPTPVGNNTELLDWESLQEKVAGCTLCGLCKSRRQAVFGVGPTTARWMVVGEAPGAEEDARGEPFVGQAGRLLDNMLASIGLSRERDVFIANILKCRPPGNRDPQESEVASCTPYLHRQIELVAPHLILLLGRFAAQTLLGTHSSIANLRGTTHHVTVGQAVYPAIVSYHPAYLLRNLPDKAKSWDDLLLARKVFNDR